MKPFISIIIPTYNHANFLKKSLQSVLDQKYHNWEIIVIDNRSTDDTDQVIINLNDNRIKLLKINNNGIIFNTDSIINTTIVNNDGEAIRNSNKDNIVQNCVISNSYHNSTTDIYQIGFGYWVQSQVVNTMLS